MFRDIGLSRTLLIYGVSIVLALWLGYILASARGFFNYGLVGLVMCGLAIPIVLRWHHWILIAAWNSTFVVFFLPGQPSLAFFMAGISFGFFVLARTLSRNHNFVTDQSVTKPLIFLVCVILGTALLTGGIGGRALGLSEWGGKKYLGIIGAVLGYLAFAGQRIPKDKATLATTLYLLGGISALGSDLAYAMGPSFYFLFHIFSVEVASLQAYSQDTIQRSVGVAWASLAYYYVMLFRYGVRGLLDITRPWRLILLIGVLGIGLLGGFRSLVVLAGILFILQFYMEGLFRSRILPMIALGAVLLAVFLVAFIDQMPLAMQRSLSFLPLKIDRTAKVDALGTLDWRISMWKIVVKDVPNYLLLGKGFTYSGTDYVLTQEAFKRGMIFTSYEDTLISGNYHNGILTILIPFGIFGMIGFLWFSWAAIRVMYRNYKYGDPGLLQVNRFLFVYFIGRWIFYMVFYGQFDIEFAVFTGTVGLSLAINGGVCSPVSQALSQEEDEGTSEEEEELETVSASRRIFPTS